MEYIYSMNNRTKRKDRDQNPRTPPQTTPSPPHTTHHTITSPNHSFTTSFHSARLISRPTPGTRPKSSRLLKATPSCAPVFPLKPTTSRTLPTTSSLTPQGLGISPPSRTPGTTASLGPRTPILAHVVVNIRWVVRSRTTTRKGTVGEDSLSLGGSGGMGKS